VSGVVWSRAAVHATRDVSLLVRLMADDPTSSKPRPVRRRLAQVLRALEETGARYAICGAVAMGAHGVRRFSEDLDVLVDAADVTELLRVLGRGFREVGREPASGPPAQVKLRARRAAGPESVDVDVLVPVDAAEEWALTSAVRGRAFGHRLDMVSLEALVLLKLRAFVSDPESLAGAKHRADVLALMHHPRLDVAGLRRLVSSHPPLRAEFERAFAAPRPRGRRR